MERDLTVTVLEAKRQLHLAFVSPLLEVYAAAAPLKSSWHRLALRFIHESDRCSVDHPLAVGIAALHFTGTKILQILQIMPATQSNYHPRGIVQPDIPYRLKPQLLGIFVTIISL